MINKANFSCSSSGTLYSFSLFFLCFLALALLFPSLVLGQPEMKGAVRKDASFTGPDLVYGNQGAPLAPCSGPDNGLGTVDIPNCSYYNHWPYVIWDEFGLPPGTTIEIDGPAELSFNALSHAGQEGGNFSFEGVLRWHFSGTGELAGFERDLEIPVQVGFMYQGSRSTYEPIQSFASEIQQLQTTYSDTDFEFLNISMGSDVDLPSPGFTRLEESETNPGTYTVDSFFDATYELDFNGRTGSALDGYFGTAIGTVRIATEVPKPNPCIIQDDGSATVVLPPTGCDKMTFKEILMIIDGLPPGTTIENRGPWREMSILDRQPGGNLGGEVTTFESRMDWNMRGTGDLDDYRSSVSVPVTAELHTAPRTPGEPLQIFATEIDNLQGEISNHPHFTTLKIRAGANQGLPSPGEATLTDLGDGTFQVDSFFDVTCEIEFEGAPGGPLDGMAGTTTGTARFENTGIKHLIINEILAAPHPVDGDANNDGQVSDSGDQFVEILNPLTVAQDLSHMTLLDNTGIRHTFPPGTVVPEKCGVLIFGGQTPTGNFGHMLVQTASDGQLALNTNGDTIRLNRGRYNLAATYYGDEGQFDQSITLDPDLHGLYPMVQHSTVGASGGALFSPGRRVNGQTFIECPATFRVDTFADTLDSNPGDTLCADADGHCSLRAALMEAEQTIVRDTILLGEGVYPLTHGSPGDDLVSSGDLDLSRDVFIQGQGADKTIIDGGCDGCIQDRLLDIHGNASVEIQAVTIMRGEAAGPGGCIDNKATLTINNSQISGCRSAQTGGAIHSSGGEGLFLINSTIYDNHADDNGGGVHTTGSSTIDTSTISGNTTGMNGGGIYNSGTLIVENSTITENGTELQGSGIYNEADATASIKSTILAVNNSEGGISECNGAPLDSQGNNIFGSTCNPYYTLQSDDQNPNTNFALNPLQDNGGATLSHEPTLSSNAIDWGDCGVKTEDQRRFRRGVEQHGWAGPDGSCDVGAVEVGYIVDNLEDLAGDMDLVGDNRCGDGHGECTLRRAIQEAGAMAGHDIIRTPAATISLTLASALDDDTPAAGDLDVTDNLTILGQETVIEQTVANRNFDIHPEITAEFRNVTLSGGQAVDDSGGCVKNSGTLILANTNIENCTATLGGGIHSQDGSLAIDRSTISGNTGTSGGGGISVYDSQGKISNSTIYLNSADGNGGGIFIDTTGTLNVENSTISGNTALAAGAGHGGGIHVTATGTLSLRHVTIADNQADEGGGIYFDSDSTFTVAASIIGDNNAAVAPDCLTASGQLTSQDFNLIEDITNCIIGGETGNHIPAGTNPDLHPLTDNGGLTMSHALMDNSPALDAISHDHCILTTDQRSVVRPQPPGSPCDIGSVESGFDFGDAPSPHATLLADDGARHVLDGSTFLGTHVDGNYDGQPGPDFDGDGADEDGLVLITDLIPGLSADLEITANSDGFLNGWLDFDQANGWEPTEQIFTDVPLVTGANSFLVAIPVDTPVGFTGLRLRFSRNVGEVIVPTGHAPNGEVEDYKILVNTPPTAQDDLLTTDEGHTAGGNLLADNGNGIDNDADGDNFTVAAVNGNDAGVGVPVTLASGATLTVTADGSFVLDPDGRYQSLAVSEQATDSCTYTIADDWGSRSTATVMVTITGVNDIPIGVNDPGYAANEDTVLNVPAGNGVLLNDHDPDTSDSLLVSTFDSSSAKGAVIAVMSNGSFSYDPTSSPALQTLAVNGSIEDTFNYTVVDGHGGQDSAMVTVTVAGRNDTCDAIDDNGVTSEDDAVDLAVLTNDTDPDIGDTLTIIGVNATNGTVSINPDKSTVHYDPNGSFEHLDDGETGSDSFTYTAGDPYGASDTATVTVTISGVNDPPVAVNDGGIGFQTDEDTRFITARVVANDRDPDVEPFFVAAVQLDGTIGTVINNGNDTFTYDPRNHFDALLPGESATDSFTYTVRDVDVLGVTPATVAITITGVNDPPVIAVNGGVSVDEGGVVLITDTHLAGQDPDDFGADLTYTLTAGPAHGYLTLITDPGSETTSFTQADIDAHHLQYRHDSSETTVDSFSFILADGGEDGAVTVPDTCKIVVESINEWLLFLPAILSTSHATH